MEHIQACVRGVLRGETECFDKLVEGLHGMVVSTAYSRLGDYHLAQDVAQNTFIVAYQHLHQLRHPLAFPAWLRRIAASQCSRLTRGQRLYAPLTDAGDVPDENGDPGSSVEREDMRGNVQHALASLPELHERALRLYYEKGYSTAHMAEVLGVPLTTVKKRLHDARRKLRRHALLQG